MWDRCLEPDCSLRKLGAAARAAGPLQSRLVGAMTAGRSRNGAAAVAGVTVALRKVEAVTDDDILKAEFSDEFAAISTGASRRDRLRFADGDALYLSGHSITSFIALPIRLYERAETGNGLADYQ